MGLRLVDPQRMEGTRVRPAAVAVLLIGFLLSGCSHIPQETRRASVREASTDPSVVSLRRELSARLLSRSDLRMLPFNMPYGLHDLFRRPELQDLAETLERQFGEDLPALLVRAAGELASHRHRALVLGLIARCSPSKAVPILAEQLRSAASAEELFVAATGLGHIHTQDAWTCLKSYYDTSGKLSRSQTFQFAVGRFGLKGLDVFIEIGRAWYSGMSEDRIISGTGADLASLKIDVEEAAGALARAVESRDLLTRKFLVYGAFYSGGASIAEQGLRILETTEDPHLRHLVLLALSSYGRLETIPSSLNERFRSYVRSELTKAGTDTEKHLLCMLACTVLGGDLERDLIARRQAGDKTVSLAWALAGSEAGQALLASELAQSVASKHDLMHLLRTLANLLASRKAKAIHPSLGKILLEILDSGLQTDLNRTLAAEILSGFADAGVRSAAREATRRRYTESRAPRERLSLVAALAKYLPESASDLAGIVDSASDAAERIESFYHLALWNQKGKDTALATSLKEWAPTLAGLLLSQTGELNVGPVASYQHLLSGPREFNAIEAFAERLILLFVLGLGRETAKSLPTIAERVRYPDPISVPKEWDQTVRRIVSEAGRCSSDILMGR